jgi:hypothetical protein
VLQDVLGLRPLALYLSDPLTDQSRIRAGLEKVSVLVDLPVALADGGVRRGAPIC